MRWPVTDAAQCALRLKGLLYGRCDALAAAEARSPSLSLDLQDQWRHLLRTGQRCYTPLTRVVAAFLQAPDEHEVEGAVGAMPAFAFSLIGHAKRFPTWA